MVILFPYANYANPLKTEVTRHLGRKLLPRSKV